jgi:hypothetical protein
MTRGKMFFDKRHKYYLIQYINTQEQIIEKAIFGYILEEDDENISKLSINFTKKYKRAKVIASHEPVEINSKLYEDGIKLVKEDFTYIGYDKETDVGFLGIILVYNSTYQCQVLFNDAEKGSAEMLVKRVKYKRKD